MCFSCRWRRPICTTPCGYTLELHTHWLFRGTIHQTGDEFSITSRGQRTKVRHLLEDRAFCEFYVDSRVLVLLGHMQSKCVHVSTCITGKACTFNHYNIVWLSSNTATSNEPPCTFQRTVLLQRYTSRKAKEREVNESC